MEGKPIPISTEKFNQIITNILRKRINPKCKLTSNSTFDTT